LNNTSILRTSILLTLSKKLRWTIKVAFLLREDHERAEVHEQISSARREYQEELTRLKNMTSYKKMEHFYGKFDDLRELIDRKFNKIITYLRTKQAESPTAQVERVSYQDIIQNLNNTFNTHI